MQSTTILPQTLLLSNNNNINNYNKIPHPNSSNLKSYSKIPDRSVSFFNIEDSPHNILNKLCENNNKNNSPICERTSTHQRKSNMEKKRKSKLEKKNLVIEEEFNIEEDVSSRNLMSKLDLNENNEIVENINENLNKLKENNENNNNNNINNDIIEENNIIITYEIESFEVTYIIDENKNNKKDKEKKQKSSMKIFQKNRNFIFPMKKDLVECFIINITGQEKIKITKKNFQGLLKTSIILALFFFMWFMMAVFINNLVEKYGSSTFSVCILPIFIMFFVKLVITANVQFFIMAVILKYRGKRYLNIVRKPLIEKVVFMALVHPMALDHFESILFYQEYLNYRRAKNFEFRKRN